MKRKAFIFFAFACTATVLYYIFQSTPAEQEPWQQVVLGDARHPIGTAGLDFSPPLQTSGRYIVDQSGLRVKLASINWYGASDILFVPGGLDTQHRDDIVASIVKMGFNSVRFPYSDQMVIENPVVPLDLISANFDLLDGFDPALQTNGSRSKSGLSGLRALDVFNACVTAMTDAGLAVIINNHITNADWCDGMNLCDSSWKNSQYGPICKIKQTTQSWIENWKTIMAPFVNNPLVIGADLRNEPRGFWGTMTWNMWATVAEQASEALLALQPNWLMFVEGVSSANDCSGARSRPVKLSVPNRLVYSSHVYSWSGWGKFEQFNKRPYPSFVDEMQHNWAFLLYHNIAPVWVGEFGTSYDAGNGDKHYWNNLIQFLEVMEADFGYWALNPRKPQNNERETYGLLEDDWVTPIRNWRLDDLQKLMVS